MHPLSRRRLLAFLTSTAAAGGLGWDASAQAAAPFDEAGRDPSFARMRASLIAAAKARDFARLAPHLDPRIELDYGGGAGAGELRKRLARTPALWDEMLWALENGGRFHKDGSFSAPYTFVVDAGKLDVYEAAVVVGKTSARAAPRAGAAAVAALEHALVKVVDWKRTDATPTPFYRRRDWVQIELADKRKAWVEAKFVRSIIDYRCRFARKGGAWKMIAFIAGD